MGGPAVGDGFGFGGGGGSSFVSPDASSVVSNTFNPDLDGLVVVTYDPVTDTCAAPVVVLEPRFTG